MKPTLPQWFKKATHQIVNGLFVEKKTGTVLTKGGKKLPDWVDAAKHLVTTSGIFDKETGRQLAPDGHPLASIARAAALAAAELLSDPLEIVADAMIEAAYARLTRETAPAAPEPEHQDEDPADAAQPVAQPQEV